MNSENTKKIAVLPDDIGLMGGTRSFLIKLLSFHCKNKLTTILAIQEYQLDNELEEFCFSRNIDILRLPKRINLFRKPYFSIVYDIYVYALLVLRYRPKLIVASIGGPRQFSGLFFLKTPLVYYIHTYPSAPKWKAKAMNLITRYLPDMRHQIITVSQYSKNKIVKNMQVKDQYINVIYNSVPLPLMKNSPKKKRIVLTVGHVVEYKNPDTWYRVAKQVIKKYPDTLFVWVGEGQLLAKMRERVAKDNLLENILLVGFQVDMHSFYEKSTIYFQPSLIESHGISIIEAMSYALPCVGSNIGGIPESIIDKETGYLCESNDINGFSDKICLLLEDENLSHRFGSKGQMVVKNKFNESTQEKSILSVYNIIL